MDVTLMLCINDDNGNPTAKVCKVDVEICRDPLALELESKYYPNAGCACYALDNRTLKFSRRKFPIKSYQSWVGNIYWDAVTVDVETANALLNYARELNVFTVDGGWVDLSDMWDDKSQPLDLMKVVTK